MFGIFFSPKKSTVIGSNNGNNSGNGNQGNGVNEKKPEDKNAVKDGIVNWQEVEEKELGAEA